MPKLFATGNSEISSREKRNMERARKVASQGMVLLENKGALPIDKSVKTIALFGNGARRTIKGGTGSGDVNSRFVVNVEQGLEDAGFSLTTKAWMDTYDTQVETARMGYFGELQQEMAAKGMAAVMKIFTEPFVEPAISGVSQKEIDAMKADLAIYVLSVIPEREKTELRGQEIMS